MRQTESRSVPTGRSTSLRPIVLQPHRAQAGVADRAAGAVVDPARRRARIGRSDYKHVPQDSVPTHKSRLNRTGDRGGQDTTHRLGAMKQLACDVLIVDGDELMTYHL